MVKGLQTTKYHLWFKGMVNGWIFMATERCKSKIKKAIAIDEVRDMCYCYCVCVCVCVKTWLTKPSITVHCTGLCVWAKARPDRLCLLKLTGSLSFTNWW